MILCKLCARINCRIKGSTLLYFGCSGPELTAEGRDYPVLVWMEWARINRRRKGSTLLYFGYSGPELTAEGRVVPSYIVDVVGQKSKQKEGFYPVILGI